MGPTGHNRSFVVNLCRTLPQCNMDANDCCPNFPHFCTVLKVFTLSKLSAQLYGVASANFQTVRGAVQSRKCPKFPNFFWCHYSFAIVVCCLQCLGNPQLCIVTQVKSPVKIQGTSHRINITLLLGKTVFLSKFLKPKISICHNFPSSAIARQ